MCLVTAHFGIHRTSPQAMVEAGADVLYLELEGVTKQAVRRLRFGYVGVEFEMWGGRAVSGFKKANC